MTEQPRTQFARNGDVHLAYQTVGTGPLDILLVDTWVHHVEAIWDFPDFARFLRRLSSIGRLIHFDRRGTGLSDPVPLDALPDFDTQVEDVVAVLDAAGSRKPAVFGTNDGTLVAMLLAANHPDRCRSLVLFAPTVKHQQAAGLPIEAVEEALQQMTEAVDESGVYILAPSRLGDEPFDRQPASVPAQLRTTGGDGPLFPPVDAVGHPRCPPRISDPTLVLNRTGNRIVAMELSKEVVSLIPDAKLVELPGEDHLVFSRDIDRVIDEIEEFLTGVGRARIRTGAHDAAVHRHRRLDDASRGAGRSAVAGPPRPASRPGASRARPVRGPGGLDDRRRLLREVRLPRPGRPMRAVRTDGVEVAGGRIRAGVHTGEVEVRGADLGGLAVHIGARVAAAAQPGEVLVSSTVKDLLAGSGVAFEDRGEHELKGVPGAWRLFAAGRGGPS